MSPPKDIPPGRPRPSFRVLVDSRCTPAIRLCHRSICIPHTIHECDCLRIQGRLHWPGYCTVSNPDPRPCPSCHQTALGRPRIGLSLCVGSKPVSLPQLGRLSRETTTDGHQIVCLVEAPAEQGSRGIGCPSCSHEVVSSTTSSTGGVGSVVFAEPHLQLPVVRIVGVRTPIFADGRATTWRVRPEYALSRADHSVFRR